MSSRLNHIDNNRSEDDEDDHINRLFPKCKPRASSLSLSPSLQHMSHDSTSSTTTSASDLCLNVSDFLSAPKESQNRNNFNRINNNKNNTRNNQCNNTRRHSAHSPVDSHYGKQIVNLQQNCWDLSDCELENTIPIIQSNNKNNTCQQYLYDNNNDDEHLSECLIPTKPYITLGTTNIESTTTQQQHKQIPLSSTNKYKKCDNHNFPNKNVVRNSKSRKQHPTEKNNGGSGLIQPTQHNNTSRIKQLSSSSHFSSSFEKEDYNKSVSLLEEGGNCHSSVIPIQAKKAPRSASGVCEKREDKILRNNSDSKSSVTKALSSSVSQSLVAMERNAIEDNCDNGIGSGCSRSSGESSNTSDFMENLVSPVVAIRGPVTSGGSSSGGGNGFSSASAAGLPTPSMGSLRDSRIEIAGGREVYSQNRIRASRRHRGYTSSSNEIMADQVTSTNISSSSSSSSKMRKKSLHSHSAYQNHHCCHTNPCCAGSTTANCTEVSHPPSSLVWEPNHSCNRRTSEQVSAASRQQYLSHSHSMGGPSQCVKCTHPHGGGGGIGYTSGGGGCCGHSHGFDYSKAFTVMTDFETGGGSRLSRNLPQLHGTTPPMSPMTIRETVFASEVRSIEKKASGGSQVSTEKPNPLHCEIRSPFQNEPVIYEGVVGGVGKVVFDDIGEWREGHVDAIIDDDNPIECGYDGGDEHDLSESQAIKKRQQQQLQLQSPTTSSSSMKDGGKEVVTPNNIDNSCISSSKNKIIAAFVSNQQGELMEGSPCASNRDGNTTPSGYESDECSGSACATNNTIIHHPSSVPNLKASPNFANKRVIGSIPIAEYEGSPKRYGLKQPTHPVSTHFDLVDVDVNPDTDQNLINHEPRTQSLIDQTIAAATSSSSSSLDNTNTNVSSNSSSRTNNHISPRALSPSQSISGGFSTRFPGFPQRVNATSTVNNEIIPTQPVVHHDNNSSNGSGSNTNRSCAATTREEFENSPLLDDSLINKKETRVNNKLGGGEKSSSCLTSELISGQLMHIGSSSADFSPDDSLESQHGSVNTTLSNSDQEVGGNMSSRNNSMHLMGEDLFDTTNEVSRGSLAGSRSQDLLYEFSETRKVLEEFFNATGHPQQPNADGASFDELDYMLRRQAGNSYVGQRLACDGPGNFVSEDSPKKPPRRGILLLGSGDGDGSDEKGSPKLISFQEISLPQIHSPSPGTHHQQQQRMSHMQSHSLGVVASTNNRSPRSLKSHSRSQSQSPPPHDPTRDINDNDIDAETTSTNTETDLGDTEVGLQVGHSRNFTLSPETTDCDSNELESELSLDYEASVHSSSRVGVTMPVVEDGLSSGNESENEDIIDVDVEFRDEHCYFTGSSEIKGACSPINRKTGNELRNGTQLALYQDNPDNVAAFFDTGNIPTGLLDWTTPSKNNSGGGFNMKDENKLLQQQGDNNPNPSDPNPTLMLMKKQISEIEKEIQLRASQQYQKLQNSETELGGRGVLVDEGLDINPVSTTTNNIKNEPKSPPSSHERVSFDNKDCESESQFQNRESNDRPNGGESMKTSSTLTTGKNNSENMETSGAELVFMNHDPELDALDPMRPTPPPSPAPGSIICQENSQQQQTGRGWKCSQDAGRFSTNFGVPTSHSGGVNFDHLVEAQSSKELSCMTTSNSCGSLAPTPPPSVAAAIQDIKEAIQRTKPLPQQRQTDRSLVNLSSASNPPTGSTSCTSHHSRVGLRESHQHQHSTSSQERERAVPLICDSSPVWVPRHPNPSRNLDHISDNAALRDPLLKKQRYDDIPDDDQEDTDQETDRLLGQTRTEDDYGFYDEKEKDGVKKKRSKEDFLKNPSVLIEGVLFRARYLGSTQLVCEGQPTKATRMMQAEEAVSRIKAPEGETQPSTEVDLFISTEKIMVLNTDLKEIMMDHALRTISYIADIGDLVVLMARRRPVPTDSIDESKPPRPPKMICHVFESDEAQYIAQSIGQAFQVAYMEFLKANGIEDSSFVREMDYQEVLNSQEIFGDELQMFAKKELQKEVVVPKTKGEILGVVIVESGWGSMLPTVVIANLAPAGAAARCGQLNIGDQIIAINGVSLVGLPLSTCQNYIKNTKSQTVVKLTVVPCPPVVEVKIKRPDTKYQLGFSVQNGVICSLLRGGIAERGGVRVGHRIIEINNQSVVAVPHEKIVNLLATSVGEINMKTMPTSMFRLLTGQETPLHI